MELEYNERRAFARNLYVSQGKTAKDTAIEANVDEATVRCWSVEGNWDAVKRSNMVSKETQIKYLHQALDKLSETMAADKTTKSIDLYNKYVAAIRDLEGDHSISHIIEVFELFLNWLRRNNLPLAKKITPHLDKFIQSRYSNSAM